MLRVVVAAPPAVHGPRDLADLPPAADLVELRLDLLRGGAWDAAVLADWIARSPRPVLATVRSRREGGAFDGTPAQAARLLVAAARAGAAWVDVEGEAAAHLADLPPDVRVVAAYHGDGAPALPREVAGREVAQWKVARAVADAETFARVRREAVASVVGHDLTVVPYGPLGGYRAACMHAEALLYGSAGSAVVEGQPALLALLDELRAGEVGPEPRLFGLLGRPPGPSPSPALHNAVFRHLDLDALYLPLPGLAVETALTMPFEGLSVTTPYKESALALADDADDVTRSIGACNTLVRAAGGAWRASNTDAEALLDLIPPAADGAAAVICGAGGFARAALFALRHLGYRVRIAARDDERARALAAHGEDEVEPGGVPVRREADRVVVNATPLGVGGEVPAFLARMPLDDLLVVDAPYARAGHETGLVRAVRAAAAGRVVTGLDLLAQQALGQARAFTGERVPRRLLEVALAAPLPLLLLGLRGAGKSTVGRRVARRLGRPFLDLDDEVLRITGRAPAAWIRERGEDAFRAVELDALGRLVGRRGVVVAAGGGVLERSAARALVSSHTVPVWLDVPPETAARRVAADGVDRPPLASVPAGDPLEEARGAWSRRHAAWRRLARAVVDATASVEIVAERVDAAWTTDLLRRPSGPA
jgi:shikimate 5-dehydrogenase/shikimate kinase/3-dehydroquinate dehydratase